MAIRARVDRHKCIGAGNCITLAPTAFDWLAGDYGKADVVGPESVDEDVLRAAAFACPTAAIILEDVSELLPWQLRGKAGPARRVMKTFMFTDIVGSTTLVEALGDEAWEAILRWHNTALREVFAAHTGEEISTTGDGFFVSFDSPDLAVAAAIAIQRRLAEHRATQGFAPQVRIGLHASDATWVGGDFHGKGVHEASRIAALGGAGDIVASVGTVGESHRTSDPPNCDAQRPVGTDRGRQRRVALNSRCRAGRRGPEMPSEATPSSVARRGGALPDDELGGQLDPCLLRPLAASDREHELGRGLGHLDQRLTDRGQGRTDPPGDGQVVEPDDAEVFRDVQPEVAGDLVDAQRLEIVAGEDRGRRIGHPQEDPRAIDALLHVESAVTDELRIDRHAGRVHRRPEPVDASTAAQDVLRPADDRDPRVTEGEEVTRRRQAPVPVRGPDGRRVAGQLAGRVHDHERDAPRPELVAHRLAEVGEDRDHTGRPPRKDALDPAATRDPAPLHLRQDHRQ